MRVKTARGRVMVSPGARVSGPPKSLCMPSDDLHRLVPQRGRAGARLALDLHPPVPRPRQLGDVLDPQGAIAERKPGHVAVGRAAPGLLESPSSGGQSLGRQLPLLAPASPEIAQGVVATGKLPADAGQPGDRQGTAASIGEPDLAGEHSGFSPRGIAHVQLERKARVDETEPELCPRRVRPDGGVGEKPERCAARATDRPRRRSGQSVTAAPCRALRPSAMSGRSSRTRPAGPGEPGGRRPGRTSGSSSGPSSRRRCAARQLDVEQTVVSEQPRQEPVKRHAPIYRHRRKRPRLASAASEAYCY